MTNFNQRFCIYGSANHLMTMAEKSFLHSFLRKDLAMNYIKEHSKRIGGWDCYDIYVGGEILERVYLKGEIA